MITKRFYYKSFFRVYKYTNGLIRVKNNIKAFIYFINHNIENHEKYIFEIILLVPDPYEQIITCKCAD